MSAPFADLRELWELGVLQELNRQFLHPIGLALAFETFPDGTIRIPGILDARSDPEGFEFDPEVLAGPECHRKAEAIAALRLRFAEARRARFGGSEIQPIFGYGGRAGERRSSRFHRGEVR